MKRALAAIATLSAIAAACALAESGLLPVDGGVAVDANLPEACATLDAACLGTLAQSGTWTPVALAAGACGADWSSVHLKTNPHDTATSCACGACSVVGAYACEAGVPIVGGNGGGDSPFMTATPGQCSNGNATQHLLAHGQSATGAVGCFAPNDAGAGASADDLALCVPGCAADFCGGAQQCVMAEGDVACPSGFTLAAHAGTDVDPGCAPCPCEAGPPGACTGTITAFYQNNCNAADDAGTFALDTCNFISQQYKSVHVDLVAPDASCAVTSQPAGDASLVGEKTLCCR